MAWLAVDRDGDEYIYSERPIRGLNAFYGTCAIPLPYGVVEMIIGRKLTWEDEPVEI